MDKQFKKQKPVLSVKYFIDEMIHQYQEPHTVLELFAGAGGFALGFEQAGFKHALLNEIDKKCCETLRGNRPEWPVIEADITQLDFYSHRYKVDVVAGGFPCQAFSVAGMKKGFEDSRGQLFFQFARAVKQVQPKIFIAENVKGLFYHDKGKTLECIVKTLTDSGYIVLPPKLLKAVDYGVPQKRERIFIIGVRNDLFGYVDEFCFPKPSNLVYTLRDALKKGAIHESDVPISNGSRYSVKTEAILDLVPPGGNYRDLPIEVQKNYLGEWYKKGSNAQVAKRLSWDEPCLTLLTRPQSKRIERCHPDETRPLTVREYARIQTFPDNWEFSGSSSLQYRQIGNAVPVALAKVMAMSIKDFLERGLSHERSYQFATSPA